MSFQKKSLTSLNEKLILDIQTYLAPLSTSMILGISS